MQRWLLTMGLGLCACPSNTSGPAPTGSATAVPSGARAAPRTSATAAPSAFTFGTPEAKLGARYISDVRMRLGSTTVDAELPGVVERAGMTLSVKAAVKVLLAKRGRPTKWAITFDEATVTMGGRGPHEPEALPTKGRSYRVERKGEALFASTEDGGPVAEEERLQLLLPVDALDGWALPRRPLAPGDAVPELVPEGQGEARFVERRGDLGLFERTTTTSAEGVTMTMQCRALLRIRDGQVTAASCRSRGTRTKSGDGAATTGGVALTVTRTAPGEPPPEVPQVNALWDEPKERPEAFDAVCYGDGELTDKQRFHIQQRIDEGDDPCPGWLTPTLVLAGWKLPGGPLAVRPTIPEATSVRVEALFTRLKRFRARWVRFHPTTPFDGELTVIAKPTEASAAVASVATTGQLAGYGRVALQSGGDTVRWRATTFGPLAAPGSPRHVVFVEPKGETLAVHRIELGGKASAPQTIARDGYRTWRDGTCPQGVPRCVDAIEVRVPRGAVRDLVQIVQALAIPAKAPPPIGFTNGCTVPPKLSPQAAGEVLLGPRRPAGPCP